MQDHNYPSIMRFKELEASINILLNAYSDVQSAYEQSVSVGNMKDAKRWIDVMDNINKNLGIAIAEAGDVIQQIAPQGIKYQNIATLDASKLNLLTKQLDMKSKEVAGLRSQLTDIDGDMQTSGMEQTGNYFQMIVLLITALAIAWLIGKSVVSSETSSADNIILVVAALALLYHLIKMFT
jgi:hypothetical protein